MTTGIYHAIVQHLQGKKKQTGLDVIGYDWTVVILPNSELSQESVEDWG